MLRSSLRFLCSRGESSGGVNINTLPTNEMMRVLRQRAQLKATARARQSHASHNTSHERHLAHMRNLMSDVDASESPGAAKIKSSLEERRFKARMRNQEQLKEQPRDEREILDEMFHHVNTPQAWGMTYPLDKWYGCKTSQSGALVELNLSRSGLPTKLKGTLDLAKLPRSLRVLDLSDNEFDGEVDFETLPPYLETLHLNGNRFTGKIGDAGCLSRMMSTIDLSGNLFTGEVSFESLPQQLVYLNLSRNAFDGPVGDLSKLPPTLKGLDISENSFSGELDLNFLLAGGYCLEDLFAGKNNFTGRRPGLTVLERLENVHISDNNFGAPRK